MLDDEFSDDFDFEPKPPTKSKSAQEAAKKLTKAKQRPKKAEDDWPDDSVRDSEIKREGMSAQDRIAAMKARLAGIRASDIPDEEFTSPVQERKAAPKFKTAQPSKAVQQTVAQQAAATAPNLARFSEAPGNDDELYEEEFLLPSTATKQAKAAAQTKPPKVQPRPPPPTQTADDPLDEVDDVPEIDTRIRSTMALEKHWSEVEEKRKREEALRKRRLKEKHVEIANEEQRLLLEIQEKKRREEETRKRLQEEEARRLTEDWKQKEDEQRKKFDAKIKGKELQLQRLEEARKKREDAKKKLKEEEDRRRREFDAEMARLTNEEEELQRKIADEEESKRQAIADEEKRRQEEAEKRERAEEERKRKEAEEEMRLLEEEEKELIRREREIERELEEKRRKREDKLKEIQQVLQSTQAKKEEAERKAAGVSQVFADVINEVEAGEEENQATYNFCMNLGATARRIDGTIYAGVFSGSQAVDTLLKTLGLVGSRAEGVAWGQRALKRKLLWPLEGRDVFEDSERLYNLEDSHPMVQRAREDAAKVPLRIPAVQAVAEPVRSVPVAQPVQQHQPPKQQLQQQQPPPLQVVHEAPAKVAEVFAAELRVVDDANQQLPKYEFQLPFGVSSIGRRSDNAISLPVLSVSKKHANFECNEDGSFFVTDLGSSNKTRLFADGNTPTPVILRPNTPYQVYSGAEILFGEIRCAFEAFAYDYGEEEAVDNSLYYDEVQGEYQDDFEYYDEGEEEEGGWTEAEQLQALEEARREVARAGKGPGKFPNKTPPSKAAQLERFSVAPPAVVAPPPPGVGGLAPRSLGMPMKKAGAKKGVARK